MGAFISKQPNGLYCRFSTVVDTVTAWNMTEEDYIEMCAEKAREEAREVLKDYLYPFKNVKDSFYPNNNTIEEFEQILHEMGDEEGLGEERIKELKKIEND